MEGLKTYLVPIARVLMSGFFIWSGIYKLQHVGTVAEIFGSDFHVPAANVAVWIAIVVEILGGLAILLGFKVRWAAAALAIYCLGTAFRAHWPAGDYTSDVDFYKNLSVAAGLLYIIAYGAGGISIDGKA